MRTSGILMHISSLPSRYGIGTLGSEAYRFVDFLAKAGQTYWQILPLGPTGYGDSPYSSSSTFAGNPYFIDLVMLRDAGLVDGDLLDGLNFGGDPSRVNYGLMYLNRKTVLRQAVERFFAGGGGKTDAYKDFVAENSAWLGSFALFSALKDRFGGVSWQEWPEGYRRFDSAEVAAARTELAGEIEYHKAVQFLFFSQWYPLKKYANEKGIKIIGDIPIYVALDSADVWSDPGDFLLDGDLKPVAVAGCPPDAFSDDGQLWGNPLYRWDKMKKDGYGWWLRRIAFATRVHDVVRIDHFRGFESYWSIPYGDLNAKGGKWVKGPDYDIFRVISEKLGKLPIIAEDLGVLTPPVYKLLERVGYPGMKVLEFAFTPDADEENEYLPHNITKNSVAYIGTHDNETAVGWLMSSDPEISGYAKEYMHLSYEEGLGWGFIRTLLASPADTAIIQMQDLIVLGNEGRMNTPSTLGGNWTWRIRPECVNDWLAGILYAKTALYKRLSEGCVAAVTASKEKLKPAAELKTENGTGAAAEETAGETAEDSKTCCKGNTCVLQ